jgi:SAM-dependent methyltransferase
MPDYSATFFEGLGRESRQAAGVVVPLLIDLLHPGSVVDVGCGTGEWLVVFRQHGVEDVVGIDGDWIPPDQLQIPASQFQRMDLRQGVRLDRTFDLAVCVEVAEHLPDGDAEALIAALAHASPVTLFSAAIPLQGGTGHVNEQWPSYWLDRFARHGYVPVNCLRPRIWNDPAVAPYLAQNLMLLVSRPRLENDARLAAEWQRYCDVPLDLVHPKVYLQSLEHAAQQRVPLLSVLRIVGETLKRQVRAH